MRKALALVTFLASSNAFMMAPAALLRPLVSLKANIPAWLNDAPDVPYINGVHEEQGQVLADGVSSTKSSMVTVTSIKGDLSMESNGRSYIPAWLSDESVSDVQQVNGAHGTVHEMPNVEEDMRTQEIKLTDRIGDFVRDFRSVKHERQTDVEPKGTDTKIKSDFLPHTPEIIDTTMNYIKSENAVDSHVKSYIPAWLRDAPDVEYIDEVHDEMEAKTESQNGWIVTASSIATDAKRGSCIPAWLRNAPEPDLEQVNDDIMEAQAFNELQERRETTIECLMKEIELKDAEQEALVAQLQDAMKSQEITLQNRIKDIVRELRAVKYDAHKGAIALRKAQEVKEAKLNEEIELLRQERSALEMQLKDLKQRYTTDANDWEDRLEAEQDRRIKEGHELTLAMEALQKTHMSKIKEMLSVHETKMQQLKVDATNQLTAKEESCRNMGLELKVAKMEIEEIEDYVHSLEEERASLRQMAKQGWKVLKGRVSNRWKKIKTRNH